MSTMALLSNKTLHDIIWDSAEVLEQENNWIQNKASSYVFKFEVLTIVWIHTPLPLIVSIAEDSIPF